MVAISELANDPIHVRSNISSLLNGFFLQGSSVGALRVYVAQPELYRLKPDLKPDLKCLIALVSKIPHQTGNNFESQKLEIIEDLSQGTSPDFAHFNHPLPFIPCCFCC